jgi:hypothetical protein
MADLEADQKSMGLPLHRSCMGYALYARLQVYGLMLYGIDQSCFYWLDFLLRGEGV